MRGATALALTLLVVGCGATSRSDREPADGDPPDASGGDGAGGAAPAPQRCDLPPPSLTRLTFDELVRSARVLLGDELGDELTHELGEPFDHSFPPLASPREGTTFTQSTFTATDRLGQIAGGYVREHFELTECADDDFACVRDYVADLGERAFRRPLEDEERTALLRPIEQAEALGVRAAFGAEYGVYAVFTSPHFLYRRELGEASSDAGPGELRLTDHELASTLSFFLTGGPPDRGLLEAAAAGALTTREGLEPHVERLLAAPEGRRHLETMLSRLMHLPQLDTVVIDPAAAPVPITRDLIRGMRVELEALISAELWGGGVGRLLTSRGARIDANLATLYGVEFPPAGATPDTDGFVDTELPEERAGLLTRAGWATLSSRPDSPSVIGRGLRVMELLCEPMPAFPDLDATVRSPPDQSSFTSRQRAEYRMTTEPCAACHGTIDPLGLALEDLDIVGKFRSVDAEGRPIDAAITLPAFAGGASVDGALELSRALPEDAIARCLSQRFLTYALSAWAPASTSCERDALAEARAESGDQSFANVIQQIALSRSFRLREP